MSRGNPSSDRLVTDLKPPPRKAVVVPDEVKTFTVTKESLYKAACTRSDPCGAHKDTVDKMIKRLEKQDADND